MKVELIVPIYNAEKYILKLLESLFNQSLKVDRITLIDSESDDYTQQLVKDFDVNVIKIKKSEFNHAATRTLGAKTSNADILIFLTQDSIPANKNLIKNLVRHFQDSTIAAVGGRQLPNFDADIYAKHLRYFNYPDRSFSRNLNDKQKYGFKTIFLSNSVAAYRKDYLEDIGWFGNNNSFGEDSLACARLLLEGYNIQYDADAIVYHSHNYTIQEEFQRYINIGEFHAKNSWLIDEFGSSSGEGFKYIKSVLKYLWKHKKFFSFIRLPFLILAKFLGYKIGKDRRLNNLATKLRMYK